MITERAEAVAELAHLGARPSAALEWVCRQIDDSMLRVIAECDYGFDADWNFDLLSAIRAERRTPDPLEWNPAEVLRLTRWSRCDRKSRDEHLCRYFACAALVCASATTESLEDSLESTLIRLIESARVLGDNACWLAFQSAASLVQPEEVQTDESLFLSGLIILAAPFRTHLRDPSLLPYLIDTAKASALRWGHLDKSGTRFVDLGMDEVDWRRAARQTLEDPRCTTASTLSPNSRTSPVEHAEFENWVTVEISRFLSAFRVGR